MNAESTNRPLQGKRIILGVTGGIAAYKATELASKMTQMGARVYTVMTANACEFISPLTFRSLTGHPVLTGLFDEPQKGKIAHVDIPSQADLFLVAPATANAIGKFACGIADDWLSTAALVATCPKIIAPAMNTNMYNNPIVAANVERLRSLGWQFVEPDSGMLACGTEGVGRLADPGDILAEVVSMFSAPAVDLSGMKLLVTAGPTREPIDAVRFVSNYSSGKMGYAIAESAARMGAQVTLVSGPTALATPCGVKFVQVETAKEMLDAATEAYRDVNVFISAAAVADYSPKSPESGKMKKSSDELSLAMQPTEDILKTLGRSKGERILVGFAAETDDLVENAKKKIVEKNLDMIVANQVFQEEPVFGSDSNTVTIITANGVAENWPRMTKHELASKILIHIQQHLWRNGI